MPDCTLTRTAHRSDGIFSELESGAAFRCVGLEHSFQIQHTDTEGAVTLTDWEPAVPTGVYVCRRGVFTLDGITAERFEITGVPRHTGILIHKGNKDSDSKGCLLLGNKIQPQSDNSWWVIESEQAFDRFMDFQEGVEQFQLSVI
jgi:Family of unknown function (DUF5675)